MARLFISYKREEADYAFAVRQWLIDKRGWGPQDIFVDLEHLRGGDEWAKKLFSEAESCNAMLFLASEGALHPDSFCYRELRRSGGPIIAVTIGELTPDDQRLRMAIPHESLSRQITQLDQQPTTAFEFVRLTDNSHGAVTLNAKQLENIHEVLRALGVAPNSFEWTPNDNGPYPGLRPLFEGDEALFCGRDTEIRDGLREIEDFKESVLQRALIIQAPSGAGKSSFLRAGLWQRLRRHHGFTPLCIVRAAKGVITNQTWGLIEGLNDPRANHLRLPRSEIAERARGDLPAFFAQIADADAFKDEITGKIQRRTLLLGIDQAEEIVSLDPQEEAELARLFAAVTTVSANADDPLDLRLILTARDDSLDATRDRLAEAGIAHQAIRDFRLHRMPSARFRDIIVGPAEAANRAKWPIVIDPALDTSLAEAAAKSGGDVGDALPILALSLRRLVANYRKPDDGQITLQPDKAESFLEESVREATTEALLTAQSDELALRRLIIPRLATWDPHVGSEGSVKRQVALDKDLFSGERQDLRGVADALVGQHLLTKSETPGGTAYEVAHEAILRVPPLGQMIYERRETYIQAQMLEAEAADWDRFGRRNDRLARRGGRLAEAQALLEDEDFGEGLTSTQKPVTEYVAACAKVDADERQREERFRQAELASARKTARRTAVGLVVALILLVVSGGLGFVAYINQKEAIAQKTSAEQARLAAERNADRAKQAFKSAEKARKSTLLNQSKYLAGLAQQQLNDGDVGTGLLLALEALPDHQSTEANVRNRPYWSIAEQTLDAAMRRHRELALLKGHTSAVRGIAVLGDGRLATSSSDMTVRIWAEKDGKWATTAILKGHWQAINAIAVFSDGRLATASSDRTVRVWAETDGIWTTTAILKGHGHSVNTIAVLADGRIATGSWDKTVRVWAEKDGKWSNTAILKGHTRWVYSIAVLADGRLASGAWDNTVRVWTEKAGQWTTTAVLKGHTRTVYSVVALADGRLATGSSDKTVRVWTEKDGEWTTTAILNDHTRGVYAVAVLAGGRLATGSADKTVRVWTEKNGEWATSAILKAHTSTVQSIAVLADGRFATGSSDDTVRVWAKHTVNRTTAILKDHRHWVKSLTALPNGSLAAGTFRTIRIWTEKAGQWKTTATLKGHRGSVSGMAVLPDGRLASGAWDNTVRVWAQKAGRWTATAVLKGHSRWVYDVAALADGRLASAAEDRTVRVWAENDGRWTTTAILKGHTRSVRGLAVLADGRLATASWDRTVRVWAEADGKWTTTAILKGHTGSVYRVIALADGRLATGASDGTVRVWRERAGNWKTMAVLRGHQRGVNSIAALANGRLVTGSSDNKVRVWAEKSGNWTIAANLDGHTNTIHDIAVLPDGRVATGSKDRTVRVWPHFGDTARLIAKAKSIIPRCLTPTQRKQFYLAPEPPRWCDRTQRWPYDAASQFQRGRRLALRGTKDAEAAQEFAKAVAKDPNLKPAVNKAWIYAHMTRGKRLLSDGKKDAEAAKQFAKAVAKDPSLKPAVNRAWINAHMTRGKRLLRDGTKDAEAAKQFAKAVAKDPKRKRDVNKAWVYIYMSRGEQLLKAGNKDAEAAQQFTKAITRDPKQKRSVNKAWANAYMSRGKQLLSDGKKDTEADQQFAKAVARDPKQKPAVNKAWVDAYMSRGIRLLRSGTQDAEARMLFAKAVSRDPNQKPAVNKAWVDAYMSRGKRLLWSGQKDAEADMQFAKALTLDSGKQRAVHEAWAQTYTNRGIRALNQKSYTDADEHFYKAFERLARRVIAVTRGGKDQSLAVTHYFAARSKLAQDSLSTAYNHATKSLAALPGQYQFLTLRARILTKLNRDEEALADVTKALKSRHGQQYVEALVTRGLLLEKMGKTDEARTDYEQATKLRVIRKEQKAYLAQAKERLKALATTSDSSNER